MRSQVESPVLRRSERKSQDLPALQPVRWHLPDAAARVGHPQIAPRCGADGCDGAAAESRKAVSPLDRCPRAVAHSVAAHPAVVVACRSVAQACQSPPRPAAAAVPKTCQQMCTPGERAHIPQEIACYSPVHSRSLYTSTCMEVTLLTSRSGTSHPGAASQSSVTIRSGMSSCNEGATASNARHLFHCFRSSAVCPTASHTSMKQQRQDTGFAQAAEGVPKTRKPQCPNLLHATASSL